MLFHQLMSPATGPYTGAKRSQELRVSLIIPGFSNAHDNSVDNQQTDLMEEDTNAKEDFRSEVVIPLHRDLVKDSLGRKFWRR